MFKGIKTAIKALALFNWFTKSDWKMELTFSRPALFGGRKKSKLVLKGKNHEEEKHTLKIPLDKEVK